jgi:V/A-type H+-transporting ATPase subunit E
MGVKASMKIKELTQKIYQDGVAKAKEEEKSILERAREEADAILAAAKQEAERIARDAERAAKDTQEKLEAEIELSAQQALSLLRQRVSDLLVEAALEPAVQAVIEDKPFIEELIRMVVEKWDTGRTSLDLALLLPEAERARLDDFFRLKAKDLLEKGIEIRFNGRMTSGFAIAPKDGAYKLSFGESDFVEFFKSFLRQRTKDILFPGKSV